MVKKRGGTVTTKGLRAFTGAMTARRRQHDRGAALVEFALVVPLFLAVAFTVVEFGMLGLRRNLVTGMPDEAARFLALHPQGDGDVDDRAIRLVMHRAGDRTVIDHLIVYAAAGPGEPPTAACIAGTPGAGDRCNIFTGADVRHLAGDPDHAIVCGSRSTLTWCPDERMPGEFLGVWIRSDVGSVTGMFPSTRLERFAVEQLESAASEDE